MFFEIFNIYTTSLIFFPFLFININKSKTSLIENKSEQISNSRIYFFDFIKGISIICVVLMHIIYFYYDSNQYGNFSFLLNYFLKIFRFSVPFFIISSGFLLNLKSLSPKNVFSFYNKKIFKLIIPYFIFCILFFVLKNNYFNLKEFIYGFITGNILIPYYFMSILFQFYIIYPIIFFLMNKFNNKNILILSFIISFISSMFLYKINNFYIFLPYLIYFVFGIFLKKQIKETNLENILKSKNVIRFNIFIITIYSLFGLIGLSEHYSNFQFAYSISLFLLFFVFKEKIENKFKTVTLLGKNSLYIFLTHFFIIESINNLIKNKFNITIEFIIFLSLSILITIFIPLIFMIIFQKNKREKLIRF